VTALGAVFGNCHVITSIVPHVINLKKLQYLNIDETSHSEEDLNYVREIVRQALPDIFISDDMITNDDDDDDDDDDNDDDDDDDDDDD